MGDYFNPTKHESKSSKNTEIESRARNMVPNNFQTGNATLFHNRKRNESNDGMTRENIHAQKQLRQEDLRISESLSPYYMSGSSNPDFVPEINAETSDLVSYNSHSISPYREFLNLEESQAYNQGMEEIGCIGEKRSMNSNKNIQSNISLHGIPFDRSPLSFCSNYPGRDTGMGGNYQPTQTLSGASIHTDVETWPRNIVPNDMEMSSMSLVCNSRKSESNDRIIGENIQRQKQPKQKIRGISDKVLSPNWKQGSCNPDMLAKINAESSHLVSKPSFSNDLHNEFLNFEDHMLINQGIQELGCLGESKHLTIKQKNAKNIGIFQTCQYGKDLGRMPHFKVWVEESVPSMNGLLPVPGPSNIYSKENVRNLGEEKLLSTNALGIQSVMLGNEKGLICTICDREISKHVHAQSENIYYCCVCQKSIGKKANLQMHIDLHYPKKVCNICKKEYIEWDLHESVQICKVCNATFSCKTLLDHHSTTHEEYFFSHCWVCSTNIDDHLITHQGKKHHMCCICKHLIFEKGAFKEHILAHRPSLFCMMCKQEYPLKEKTSHNSEYTCILCDEKFLCTTLFQDHYIHHKKYFDYHCIACNEKIESKHIIVNMGKQFYRCCRCLHTYASKYHLLGHLYICSNIRPLKCDVCGRRFAQYNQLVTHSLNCIPMPDKCEICRARFPNQDMLEKHRIKQHESS